MATDCQWQRGENFRKNSGRWGSQGWDSSSQCPPAMPQPPSDPQESLSRKSSLVNQETSTKSQELAKMSCPAKNLPSWSQEWIEDVQNADTISVEDNEDASNQSNSYIKLDNLSIGQTEQSSDYSKITNHCDIDGESPLQYIEDIITPCLNTVTRESRIVSQYEDLSHENARNCDMTLKKLCQDKLHCSMNTDVKFHSNHNDDRRTFNSSEDNYDKEEIVSYTPLEKNDHHDVRLIMTPWIDDEADINSEEEINEPITKKWLQEEQECGNFDGIADVPKLSFKELFPDAFDEKYSHPGNVETTVTNWNELSGEESHCFDDDLVTESLSFPDDQQSSSLHINTTSADNKTYWWEEADTDNSKNFHCSNDEENEKLSFSETENSLALQKNNNCKDDKILWLDEPDVDDSNSNSNSSNDDVSKEKYFAGKQQFSIQEKNSDSNDNSKSYWWEDSDSDSVKLNYCSNDCSNEGVIETPLSLEVGTSTSLQKESKSNESKKSYWWEDSDTENSLVDHGSKEEKIENQSFSDNREQSSPHKDSEANDHNKSYWWEEPENNSNCYRDSTSEKTKYWWEKDEEGMSSTEEIPIENENLNNDKPIRNLARSSCPTVPCATGTSQEKYWWEEQNDESIANTDSAFNKALDEGKGKMPSVAFKDTSYKVETPDHMKDWYDPLTGEEKKKKRYCDEWNDEVIEKPKNSSTAQPTSSKIKPTLRKTEPVEKEKKSSKIEIPKLKPVLKNQPTAARETLNQPSGKKSPEPVEGKSAPPAPPPPPPAGPSSGGPPPPPPPPPPPGSGPPTEAELKLRKARQNMVEKIKKASRARPDWQSVMKDIEGGIKLKKVDSCDKLDRSSPILPSTREQSGKFLYDSEKPMVQNELLHEIHRGIKLRHVRTNDRSKPDFNKLGLKKLRRQLTVEEKKNMDPDNPETLPSSSDEEDDIDRMRDDLSATKAQLADEIKKNKKMETEHKILKIDIESLQAEVKKMRRKLRDAGIQEVKPLGVEQAQAIGPKLSKSMSKLRMREEEMDYSELDVIEEDIKLLNDEIEAQKKRAEKSEQKCEELKLKLQVAGNSAEEWEMRSIYFEKKCKHLQKDIGIELPDINCVGVQCDSLDIGPSKSESTGGILAKKSASRKSMAASFARMESFKEEDESEEESTSSEDESTISDQMEDEEEEQNEEDELNDAQETETDQQLMEGGVDNQEDSKTTEEEKQDIESKREERDFIMWKNKLSHMKDKERNVRKERNNLRERVKKFYKDMRTEREEYLKIKAELEELSDQMKECLDNELEDEDIQPDEESGVIRSGNPQIPVQFRNIVNKPHSDDDGSEDEITDLSGLETPEWEESDAEKSDSEEDENDTAKRLKQIQERTKKYETKSAEIKKDTYKLKAQLNDCEEMLTEEKWRHDRLQNELQMLLADI